MSLLIQYKIWIEWPFGVITDVYNGTDDVDSCDDKSKCGNFKTASI